MDTSQQSTSDEIDRLRLFAEEDKATIRRIIRFVTDQAERIADLEEEIGELKNSAAEAARLNGSAQDTIEGWKNHVRSRDAEIFQLKENLNESLRYMAIQAETIADLRRLVKDRDNALAACRKLHGDVCAFFESVRGLREIPANPEDVPGADG